MVNYNDYPTLLYISFDKETTPGELAFRVSNEKAHKKLGENGFQEMFAYIAIANSLQKENTTINYLLSDEMLMKIDSDEIFRNKHFCYFFRNNIEARHGVILYRNGGQYIYMLLDRREAKAVKNVEGRYICAAMFVNNYFSGFEEAVITEEGFEVLPTGHYELDMPRGGYVSFAIVTLAYVHRKQEMTLYRSDLVKERIYLL